MRVVAVVLLVAVLVSLGGPPSASGGGPKAEQPVKEHEFGNLILYVALKPTSLKDEGSSGAFEKARVVRLGGQPFLVGSLVAVGDDNQDKKSAGRVVWTPLERVIQIVEFKDKADANKFFKEAQGKDERPR